MSYQLHHIAIICSNYNESKDFYTRVLEFHIIEENYRDESQSWKLDLMNESGLRIELFSFPGPPKRATGPEAAGLRHLAFSVKDIQKEIQRLKDFGIDCEPLRTDPYTGKKYTFFRDPDNLPLELYES